MWVSQSFLQNERAGYVSLDNYDTTCTKNGFDKYVQGAANISLLLQ